MTRYLYGYIIEVLKAPNNLIVVTGLDGSGKTSLVSALSKLYGFEKIQLPMYSTIYPLLDQSGYGTPFGDKWTDRLIFALDNRLSNYALREKLENNTGVISQRGWMDSLVHGAVQGFSYEEMLHLNKVDDLIKPDASIHLICDPDVAINRIKDSVYKDKYETPEYIVKQHEETIRFYEEAGKGVLTQFDESKILIDTTHMTKDDVFVRVTEWLDSNKIDLQTN